MVEGPVVITLKNAILLADKFKDKGKNLDCYIKIQIGKTLKWESKTIKKAGLNQKFNDEYKRFQISKSESTTI
jgi:hypothetical protein